MHACWRARSVFAAVVLVSFFWGCGSEDPRPPVDGAGGRAGEGGSGGNPGGAGGDGGVGGQGGDGGDGGGGGAIPNPCGNGTLDEGEECDLGLQNGKISACSLECRIQGTCEDPIEWVAVATPSPDGDGFIDIPETNFTGHADLSPPGSCNTQGKQLVFRYTPPTDGVLFVGYQNAVRETKGNPVLIVRENCADPDSELPGLCVPHRAGIVSKVEVERGVPLHFIVDSHEAILPTWWFAIGTAHFPFKDIGEICGGIGVDPDRNRCAPGLICTQDDICDQNDPPVLHDAVVYRGGLRGQELVFSVEGEDVNGNLQSVGGRFYDALGNLVRASPELDPDLFYNLGFVQGATVSGDDLRRSADFYFNWPDLREATEVEVVLMDRANSLSEPLRRPLLSIPMVGEGEECDPDELMERCAPGLLCGEEGRCEAYAATRQALCDAAPSIEVGGEISFQENLSGGQPPSLPPVWRIHEQCPLAGWSDYFRLNPSTQIARLHLSEPTSLWIEAEGHVATVPAVMLYPGCGTVDPPLSCAAVPDGNGEVAVHYTDLAAGDYLIVVKPQEVRGFVSWTLRVIEDP